MQQWISYAVDGLANGSLYSLLALAIVFTYRSTRLLNLALGELAMLMTFVCWVLLGHLPPALGVLLTVVAAFIVGTGLELILMRKVGEGRELNGIIVSVGLLTVLSSTALWLFGSVPKPFPSPFGEGATTFHSIVLTHQAI